MKHDQSKDYSQPLDINATTSPTHNVDFGATVPFTTDNSTIATLTPATKPSPPSTETVPLAADYQQPPLLPPQTNDDARALELLFTHNPELTASDIAMLVLEPRLRDTDQAFLKMVFYAWRASSTLQGISLQWSRNIKNYTLLNVIFDAWLTSQEPHYNSDEPNDPRAPDRNVTFAHLPTLQTNRHASETIPPRDASTSPRSPTGAGRPEDLPPRFDVWQARPILKHAPHGNNPSDTKSNPNTTDPPHHDTPPRPLAEDIPPDDNSSAPFWQTFTHSEDLALRHSRNAPLTDTQREQDTLPPLRGPHDEEPGTDLAEEMPAASDLSPQLPEAIPVSPTMSQARNLAAIQFTEAMATQLGLDPGSIDMVTPPLHHISSNPNPQWMQNVERSVAQMRAASASDTYSVAHQSDPKGWSPTGTPPSDATQRCHNGRHR